MDLAAFKEAGDAVKRIAKDYRPIAELAEALSEVEKVLSEVGELELARGRAKVELAQAVSAKVKAEGELAQVRRETEQAQAVLDRVKAALAGIKL